jgi:hypothetical protein
MFVQSSRAPANLLAFVLVRVNFLGAEEKSRVTPAISTQPNFHQTHLIDSAVVG